MQVRPWLPKGIGETTYIDLGMADLAVFVPYYNGPEAYPTNYTIGIDEANDQSAYWKYHKLQALIMTDYPKPTPIVKRVYKAWESKMAREQKGVGAEHLKMAKTDRPVVDKTLNDLNLCIIADTERPAEDLASQLLTVRTKDIQFDIFFANATRKD